ncbi:MAG: T9SS type A sorting domain-containing protein, partial [Lentimicrobiaceae bacterium]|nr:T9SS type A sorting domain-containing protein [Lentimicrobiaceae bacterium]
AQSQGTSGSIARGILTYFYDRHFDNCPCTDEDTTEKSGAIEPSDLAKSYGMTVKTHPNPANTWIAFDYTLPEKVTRATLTVTDLQGRTVTTIELTGQQGQHLLDTRQLTAGTYLYTIKTNDKQINGKFAVMR